LSRSTSSPGHPTRGRAAADRARSTGTRRSAAGRSLAPQIVAIRLPPVGDLRRQPALGRVTGGLAGIRWAHAPAAAHVLRVPPGGPATARAEGVGAAERLVRGSPEQRSVSLCVRSRELQDWQIATLGWGRRTTPAPFGGRWGRSVSPIDAKVHPHRISALMPKAARMKRRSTRFARERAAALAPSSRPGLRIVLPGCYCRLCLSALRSSARPSAARHWPAPAPWHRWNQPVAAVAAMPRCRAAGSPAAPSRNSDRASFRSSHRPQARS
jgi:hypothetical protein